MTEAGRTMLGDPMYRHASGYIAAIEREAVARFLDTAEPKVAEALHRMALGPDDGRYEEIAAAILAHLRATVEGT